LSEDTGIEGVPTVVVNNKYKVLTEKINGTDEYMALINYLLSLDKDYYASGASSSKHE
jgi:thiol:disulfide interchange protein DsbA